MLSRTRFCDLRKPGSERSDELASYLRNGRTHVLRFLFDDQIREVDEWEKDIKDGGKYFFTR